VLLTALTPASPIEAIPVDGGVVCHDVRNPRQRSEVLVRKGLPVRAAEIKELFENGVTELHLALPADDDVGEDDAATRLARAIAGPGVATGQAHFGQITFSSDMRGLLRVRAGLLERINRLSGVLVMTAPSDCATDTGTTLGVVKCAPLFMSESVLQAVEQLRLAEGAPIEVEAFCSKRVAFVASEERLRGNAFERAASSLSHALEWYGSSMPSVIRAQATPAGVAAAYRQAIDDGAELILAAGAAATDPLDVMFEGLRDAGGEVEQIGIPAEPGTACWIGTLEERPVLGLASCELFGRPGALDLLLPALLGGATLDPELLRKIALGGLLIGGPSRILPYHTEDGA
jgi:molybdenum cofactor cytidylyltransferase